MPLCCPFAWALLPPYATSSRGCTSCAEISRIMPGAAAFSPRPVDSLRPCTRASWDTSSGSCLNAIWPLHVPHATRTAGSLQRQHTSVLSLPSPTFHGTGIPSASPPTQPTSPASRPKQPRHLRPCAQPWETVLERRPTACPMRMGRQSVCMASLLRLTCPHLLSNPQPCPVSTVGEMTWSSSKARPQPPPPSQGQIQSGWRLLWQSGPAMSMSLGQCPCNQSGNGGQATGVGGRSLPVLHRRFLQLQPRPCPSRSPSGMGRIWQS
mmetsp:Transcript_39993/g.64879  ORF Transcript_39993/g.64879 Transcript_39993/m.64879 type:complete len:266 (-) Transcript_39993:1300-2097(-)